MAAAPRAIHLLDLDPDLGAGLDQPLFEQARARLVAPLVRLDPGPWKPGGSPGGEGGDLGALLADGLMTRDVAIAETTCAELLGPGEVIRPWSHLGTGASIPSNVEWHVLEPSLLAVIDGGVLRTMGEWPEVMTALVSRAVVRAQTLAVALAISCITGLKIRMLVLLWHLADRFGTVGPAGVSVPVPLTHQLLARLVGASRPSVSTALKQLETEGAVSRLAQGGYMLHGSPPEVAQLMADRRHAAHAAGERI